MLWLQSGFHDAASLSPVEREHVDRALGWLQREVLAPGEQAFFLSRQLRAVGATVRHKVQALYTLVRRYIAEQDEIHLRQQQGQPGEERAGNWTFVECEEAFTCHRGPAGSVLGLGGHTGAIARGYMNMSFPNYYLSLLQTSVALRATFL